MVNAKLLIGRILDDEGLTADLNESESELLIKWLVERCQQLAKQAADERSALADVENLCRRGRAVARLVGQWCYEQDSKAAAETARREQLTWPLPVGNQSNARMILQQLLERESP